MNDCEFLRFLVQTGKINWYLFGTEGFWKINNTCLSLSEKQRLKKEEYGYSSESEWTILTTRFFVVVKSTNYDISLENFWNGIDFSWAENEGKRLDEWFSGLPDY